MGKYQFAPFKFPKSRDGKYILGLDDAGVLISRRKQLGFTQEQVAEMAGIQLSQYQRFESGERALANCSMRTGLAICAVLLFDPFEIIGTDAIQPDLRSLNPQPNFDARIPEELLSPKRAGRKQIRRDIMKAFLNYEDYSILVPYEVLDKLGSPEYIQLSWEMDERRIAIRAATADDEAPIDIPEKEYAQALLAFPEIINDDNPIFAMNWGDTTYAVEARLVEDQSGRSWILMDLFTAKEVDKKEINGAFMVPACFHEDDAWDEDSSQLQNL